MATKKRRHRPEEDDLPAARSTLAKRLNRPVSEADRTAHARCRQLIDSGYAAVDWTELLGER